MNHRKLPTCDLFQSANNQGYNYVVKTEKRGKNFQYQQLNECEWSANRTVFQVFLD